LTVSALEDQSRCLIAVSRRSGPSMTLDMKLGEDCFIVRDGNGHALA